MIRDIITQQKREIKSRASERYIERIGDLKLDNDLIKVIIGPRRAGKSFFAMHKLKQARFGYVNFDDERLIGTKDYDVIISVVNSVYDKPDIILFDEIQNLEKWELFVNRLQRQGYNLVITGSNSNLLGKELSTHLTGRYIQTSIFPLSFREIAGPDMTTSEIKEKLHDYLIYGGYPEPYVKGLDYKEYLATLFDSIIFKDVVKRFNIKYPSALSSLAEYLISNIACEFSYNTLSKVTDVRSTHTIEKYISYLEETFLVFRLNRFSFKLKEQLASNKKIYCIDNGFINSKAFSMSQNLGRLFENAVAVELYHRGREIFYWKNAQQEEVDFVVRKGTRVEQLIQVCYDYNPENKKREVRSLLKAGKELDCKNLIMITNDLEDEQSFVWFGIKGRVRFVPLWKWLTSS